MNVRQKNREAEIKSSTSCTQTSRKRKNPNRVANSVMQKNSYGLGWTTTEKMKPETNPLTIC